MASNNSKYSQEVREETAKFIIESGKSATSVGEEMGIDKNTVCRWVRDYRRKYNLRRKRNFRKETKRCAVWKCFSEPAIVRIRHQ